MISVLSVILVVLAVSGYFAVTKIVIPTMDYNTAVEYMNNQEYGKAVDAFRKLGDFKDSEEKIKEMLIGYGNCSVISADNWHTVGLKSDGTVVAVGANGRGQCDVSDWKDIVAVSADDWHTVGLKSDGTVVAVGWNEYGQCDVSGWTDIMMPKIK